MKAKKGLQSNKGFTLVELIVVLVILAILAAILVPALLGYIDRAKGQQVVLNAKSYLTAAQAEFSSMYAKDKDPVTSIAASDKERIFDTADVPCDGFIAYVKSATSDKHNHFKIAAAAYTEGDSKLFFDGSSWEEVDSFTTPDGMEAVTLK